MQKIDNLQAFLDQFDASVHDQLRDKLLKPGVDGLVMFENVAFDSSQCGRRTAVVFGPKCELLKSREDAEGKWLNDLPSQRQYPQNYYEKPRLADPEPA